MYPTDVLIGVRRAVLNGILLGGLAAFATSPVFGTQSVTLVWNPSTNTDVVNYEIFYGPASQTYTNVISVGNVTNATVSGLVEGGIYYFAAKAVNTSGVASPFSNETSYKVPKLQVTPVSLSFGTASVGTSQTLSFTVANIGGGTLSGAATVSAPFSIVSGGSYNLSPNQSQTVTVSFNPVSAGNYNGTVTLTGGGGAITVVSGSATELGGTITTNIIQGPTVAATSGTLNGLVSAGTVLSGGTTTYVYQPLPAIGSTSGGSATYQVTTTNAGYYEIQALVYAPNLNANSFLVNIDGQPQNPTMIWDIMPITSGFEQRIVSWRGNGSENNDQIVPKTFYLDAGPHQIVFVGREQGTALANFRLLQVIVSTNTAPKLTAAAPVLTPQANSQPTRNGQFTLTVSGATGYSYVVQASTNLVDWVPLQTNTAPFSFTDSDAGKFKHRFYRSLQVQ